MQVLINLNYLILGITFIVNLGLGAFIFYKDRQSEVNRTFGTVLFLIAIWTLSFLMFSLSLSPDWTLFWRRITPIGSALLAGYFLYFALIFPRRSKILDHVPKIAIVAPGYFFTLISIMTPWMIKAFEITDPVNLFLGRPHFGPLYKLYALYTICFFVAMLVILFYKFLTSKGREKLQVFYVLVGVSTSVLLAIIVSLILPLLGHVKLFSLGPPFTLILAGFIAYAIVRHKLLNIENFLFLSVIFATIIVEIAVILISIASRDINFFILLSVFLAQISFGCYVLFNNYKNEINFSLAFSCFSLALWTIGVYLLQNASGLGATIFWGRFIYLGPVLLVYFFLYFSLVFPKRYGRHLKFNKQLLFVPTLIVLAIIPTSWLLESVELRAIGPKPIFGLGYSGFAIYFLLYFLSGCAHLFNKYRLSKGVEKIQIRYVFLGLFLTFLFGISTNLLLPTFGETRLVNWGPVFTLFLIGFTTYAVVKHRLMSIEMIIQRSSVYALATILIMSFYALAVMISETFFRSIIGYSSVIVTSAAALLIAILYQPLIRWFQSITDKIFFRGRYDYQQTLREISQKIASVIKLEELTRLIASSFIDTMKVSEISFLLLDRDLEHFRSTVVSLPRYKNIEIDVASPIISWLTATQDILVRDEIEDEISRQEALGAEGEIRLKQLSQVGNEMDRLGVFIWVPIISQGSLIGIIALGSKLSGDIFSAEDIGLLGTLANHVAVALENARLYNEVVTIKDYNEEILQSMTSGVLTIDIHGKIVTCNDMAQKITGRQASEIVGKTCELIWGRRGQITQVAENTLKDRCYINHEASIASPERGLVPISFSTTLLRDRQGKKQGALITIRDLSEVKELEDKVRRADKLGALATMAAGMAHEIKNPLSSMKVLTQLLPLKFNDAVYRTKFQEIIPREITRIDRIVESLLGFARSTTPNFEKSDPNGLLTETLDYFYEQASNVDVKITTHLAKLPDIEMDRGQISQVFSNLILNGIQAMPIGGELKVETLPGKTIDGVLKDILIRVSDTGVGIPADTVKKLFDPFFTNKHEGTGLGLTICHSIVDGHRGYIDVDSKVGKGTTFVVTLPVTQGVI
ncbi:MAG: histidine kinase N-terminal 7TM domain-containing protein [bacterium]